ncbi:hypothetical protein C0Q70_15449 [Pomacea canaliculata]|uniref:Uncharacterized protein n=1 Tax=Pomacea canaliculata TaxID=400727 RepID=A0A2T7NUV9_POMCA|nr:hypothetical protein C0Q70_15449 [Pomacea canaliculata]
MEGLHLASAGDDVKLWDCSQGVVLLHQFNPHNHNVASVSWNFDGSFLASCSINDDAVVLTYTKNNALTSVDLQCGTGVQCVDFNSNSRYILCGGTDGVSVWDLKTKSLKKSFKEAKGPITAARYNWNDSYIAAGSETGEIILHNTITGQSSSPLLAATAQAIRQLEYSGFKKSMFGCTSDDGVVTLWDANARRQLHVFQEAHVGPATGLAFSPINEMLMISVGLDKRMVCYDIQKKKMLKAIDTQSPLTCIDIMHDGATAAVGSTRGKIYFYDLRQGGGSPVCAFQAHRTSVQAVRFMPLVKIKNEIAEGMQNMQPMSSHRRQLPLSPRTMQNITPNRQSVQSQHCHNISLSATQLSLTSSRGEDSYAGVFSPLTNGKVEQLSSHSFHGTSSLLSTPSFLGQAGSSVHSPLPVHQSHHMSSGLLNKTSNSLTNYSSNYAGSTAPNASQSTSSQHPHSPQGSGASPSLPSAHKYSFDAISFHDPSAATASSVEQIAPLPVLQLSPSQARSIMIEDQESCV